MNKDIIEGCLMAIVITSLSFSFVYEFQNKPYSGFILIGFGCLVLIDIMDRVIK